MKKTENINKGFVALKKKTIDYILSFFKGKSYRQIVFSKYVVIEFGGYNRCVERLYDDGEVVFSPTNKPGGTIFKLTDLSLNDLREVLAELEKMKEHNQLKKP